jgi:hypothetical protein
MRVLFIETHRARSPIICCSYARASVLVPSADLHLWNMVLAVAAGTFAVAADGGLLAGFQGNVKASVLITSFSFAGYHDAALGTE